jgi:hypothetical protein
VAVNGVSVKAGIILLVSQEHMLPSILQLFGNLFQDPFLLTPFNANKNPAANIMVISPAKYGIISVIFPDVN